MSIKDKFFDGTNFEILFYVISQDLKRRFNYEINETEGKQELFNIMNQIYIKYSNKDIINLNKITLNYIAPILKNKYLDNQQSVSNIKNTNVDNNIYNSLSRDMKTVKKMPNFIDMRPERINNTDNNTDEKYDEISQRYTEKKPESINFTMNLESESNNMVTDIQELKKNRDNDMQNDENIIKNKILNTVDDSFTNISDLINNNSD